jgi:Ca2+-binding RTX toxin-like protein
VYVLQAADTLIEDVGGGIDEVQTKGSVGLAANIENLRLTGTSNTNGSGNSLDNLIYANVGNNSLNGGSGVDTASYALSSSGVTVSLATVGAQVTGGSGTDTLTNFENLGGTGYDDVLGGNGGNNVLDGAGGNDSLTGDAGNDTLIGGGGNDTLAGGTGDDVYVLQGADVIVENASEGTDEVQTSGNAGLALNIENLRLLGTGNLSGNGNGGDNVLTGNTGNNGLNGAGGNDTLVGGAGNDTLIGGSGNDTIVLNSLVGSDTITDFVSGADKLQISQSGIAVGDGDTLVEGAVSIAGPGGFAASAELVVVTGNIAGALTTASAAAAIGSATSAYAVGQETLFMVDNGTDSALYLFSSLDTDALVEAGELTLLATLAGTGNTTTGDILFGG